MSDRSRNVGEEVKRLEEELRALKVGEDAINKVVQEHISKRFPEDDARYHSMMSPSFMGSIYDAAEGQSQYDSPTVWTAADSKQYRDLLTKYSIRREHLEKVVTDQAFRSSGKGGFYNQLQNNLSRIDKFGHRVMNSTAELSGLTFITRPKLNLSTSTIKQDAQLIMLNTTNPTSIAFYLRMLLDSKLSKSDVFSDFVKASPMFNMTNPWLVPAMNNLTDISGFPDPTMDVFTSEGGFMNEQISFPAGSDRCRRTFEIQMTFNDVQYGVLLAMFQFWFEWMALLNQGIVTPYMEDMEQRKLPYTVSIYRFLFDPSRRYITRWAKCTGCFPRAVPVGGVFNISQGEVFASSAAKFTVPFTCNVFEYNKPTIIQDFNALATRYCPYIASSHYLTAAMEPQSNFIGLPYIISTTNGLQMLWRFRPEENQNYPSEVLNGYIAELAEMSDQLNTLKYKSFPTEIMEDRNPAYVPQDAAGSMYSI